MARIAIVYTTVEGHTSEIVDRMAARLRGTGNGVEIFEAEAAPRSLSGFDGVLVGGSIHMGKQHPSLVKFAKRHRAELDAMPDAFFSVSMAAVRPDPERQDEAMAAVRTFTETCGWHPGAVGLFGGALLYTQYGFIKRRVMRHIAAKKHDDTDMTRDWDYTDYAAVDRFADEFAVRMRPEVLAVTAS